MADTRTDFRTLDDLDDVRGQRVLVRVDLNVPMKDGRVTDGTRIERVLPTIRELSRKGAKVVLLAHLGRPKGRRDPAQSLAPVAQAVEEALDHRVDFAGDCIGGEAAAEIGEMNAGDVLLMENVRFHPGEEANEPGFADELASLGDIYVDDAFSASHRAHASTEGLARRLPAYAGRSMEAELKALQAALGNPKRPVLAIVGGAKVSTKLDLLSNLVTQASTRSPSVAAWPTRSCSPRAMPSAARWPSARWWTRRVASCARRRRRVARSCCRPTRSSLTRWRRACAPRRSTSRSCRTSA